MTAQQKGDDKVATRKYPERYGSIVILDNSAANSPAQIEAAKEELAQRVLHRLIQEDVLRFDVEADVPRFNDDGTATPVTVISANIDVWPEDTDDDFNPTDIEFFEYNDGANG